MTLFVDTSVWYAAAASGDLSNGRAKEILSTGDRLFTADHVLVETWTLLTVMERIGLRRVAALDDDFAVYRYGGKRDKAFEVVR